MFNVSDYYKSSISNGVNSWKLKLFIKDNRLSDTIVELSEDDIISDSLKISSQSTNNSNFTIGGVCSSKVSIILTYDGIEKLKSVNMLRIGVCFQIKYWLKVDDENQSDIDFSINVDGTENKTGQVEMGYFYIYKIENSDYNCTLELYDAMLAFDKDVSNKDAISLKQGAKIIYDWLVLFCESCSNEVYKMSVSQSLADKLINNNEVIFLDSSMNIDTYRNVMGYISILTGGFLIINRSGELDVCYYNNETSFELQDSRITDYKFDDNVYCITSLSTSIAGFDYTSSDKDLVYTDLPCDLYINENPFLRALQQYDKDELDDKIKLFIDNIFNKIKGLRFLGGSFESVCRPELELGDCITVKTKVLDKSKNPSEVVDKVFNNIIVCNILSSFQTYNTVKCNGFSEFTSKSRSSSSFKTSSDSKVTNAVMRFVGTKDIVLNAEETRTMFTVLFLLNAEMQCHVALMAIASIITAGDIEFKITYDNVEYFCRPKYTSQIGYFTYSFDIGLDAVDTDMQHSLVIEVVSKGIELKANSFDYQLVITASGVKDASAEWNGRYEVSDFVKPLLISEDNIKLNDYSVNSPNISFS